MSIEQFFRELWNNYTLITPSAGAISDLFAHWGEEVQHEHLVIRTFNDPRVDIAAMMRPFLEKGYQLQERVEQGGIGLHGERPGSHEEKTGPDGGRLGSQGDHAAMEDRGLSRDGRIDHKHFNVQTFIHRERPDLPAVFISELKLASFSKSLQQIVNNTLRDTAKGIFLSPDLILRGRIWGIPSYDIYETLRQESGYAAWVYVFGFCVNHFTVSVNALRNFGSLQAVNAFLQSNGFALNTAGGLIKGSPEQSLEQSATLADRVNVHFREGNFLIPACDYEFAFRYPDDSGRLRRGFEGTSAERSLVNTIK